MMYTQSKQGNDVIMPFLMGCTNPSLIQIESRNDKLAYDPIKQMGVYDLRTVGTYSLKAHTTHVGRNHVLDKKNEIDDQKTVK